jgi:uncharacterized protein with PQ loop repeat
MNSSEWIGISVSIGTGLSLLPQFFKMPKEKKCESVSCERTYNYS